MLSPYSAWLHSYVHMRHNELNETKGIYTCNSAWWKSIMLDDIQVTEALLNSVATCLSLHSFHAGLHWWPKEKECKKKEQELFPYFCAYFSLVCTLDFLVPMLVLTL